jgi:hypothetical protein
MPVLSSWRLYVQDPFEGHTVRYRLSAGMALAAYVDWDEWLDLAHSPSATVTELHDLGWVLPDVSAGRLAAHAMSDVVSPVPGRRRARR